MVRSMRGKWEEEEGGKKSKWFKRDYSSIPLEAGMVLKEGKEGEEGKGKVKRGTEDRITRRVGRDRG